MPRENKQAIVVAGLVLIAVSGVYAGLLEVEIPAGVTAEDALNPTPEIRESLEELINETVAAHPLSAEFGVVVLTKNGKFIYREVERTETDDWSDNRLGFHAAGEHTACWRADVPTGVYIYRLQAGDKVAVKKVVVAK